MSVDLSVARVAQLARDVLPLQTAKLSDEYFYQSLPLCVLDAVFSIGAKYDSTRQVVIRYCKFTSQRRIRSSSGLPPTDLQESITTFCTRAEQAGIVCMTNTVYENRQRTSTRGGILKAEAALLFAQALRSFGVEYLQDVPKVASNAPFESAIKSIPGQKSGISLQYFWMLAGSEDFVKPDRMVVRFLESALSRPVSINEATGLLREASAALNKHYPNLNPRLLDHEVWKYQRSRRDT